ncbi:MAG: ParB/RepB/Spo0J family partition protein [Ruminococcaceae bacterium]|nr:ParB/RepB/Spo0J family partition protein [Oscillospiraceae bacterium]
MIQMFATAFKAKNETTVQQIAPGLIDPCPYQPRKLLNKQALEDLTENIKENGILQPLTATRLPNGRYQLIAGHRRLLAATKAGLETVPVIVLDKSAEEVAVLAVIENLQREDLNFFEQAMAIQSLMNNLKLTQAQVGQKLSISQPAVANKLKLLQFSRDQQIKILAFNLTERHARAISRLPGEKQDKALDYVIKNNLNVSATDRYVNSLLMPKQKHKQKTIINLKDIRIFTNTINKAVKIIQSAGIKADYNTQEDENFIHYQISVPKIRT